MEIAINKEIKMESVIPFNMVEKFELNWNINCHALFKINGYISPNAEHHLKTLYGSKIRVWRVNEDTIQIIFCGYVSKAVIENTGNAKKYLLRHNRVHVYLTANQFHNRFSQQKTLMRR